MAPDEPREDQQDYADGNMRNGGLEAYLSVINMLCKSLAKKVIIVIVVQK